MIVTNTDFACDRLLESLSANGLPADARVIYRGRNTVAEVSGLCVKAFAVPGAIKGLIYGTMRKPKAQRAYDNALRLKTLGIDTPRPAGYVVNTAGPLLRESYYVCAMLGGYSELRGIEKRNDFDALATALAGFMLSLHRKGVFFKDFTQGNVLFKKEGGKYHFALVDINRMEFDVSDRQRLYSNFGSTLDTEAGQRMLARRYAEAAGDPSLADELMDIYRRRQLQIVRKRRIKERLRGKK